MKTNRLRETIRGGKKALEKETIEVKFLFNINVDMYVYAEHSTSHDVDKAIRKLSRGDVVLGDTEFFNKKNCEKLLAKGIKPLIKPSRNAKRGVGIKHCRDMFEMRRYKRRKNGERGAKIFSDTIMQYLDPNRRQGQIKLMATAYNIKRLIKLTIKYTVIMRQVMAIKLTIQD